MLVILTPAGDDGSDRDGRASCIRYAHIEGKPVLASWMGGADVEAATAILREAGIPTFAYPDTAVRCSTTCGGSRTTSRRSTRRRPSPTGDEGLDRVRAVEIIERLAPRGGRC